MNHFSCACGYDCLRILENRLKRLRPTRPSPNYTRNYVFMIVIANHHDHLLGARGQPHKCSKANNESTGAPPGVSWPNPLTESWFFNRARITPNILDGKMPWLVAKVRSPVLWGWSTSPNLSDPPEPSQLPSSSKPPNCPPLELPSVRATWVGHPPGTWSQRVIGWRKDMWKNRSKFKKSVWS